MGAKARIWELPNEQPVVALSQAEATAVRSICGLLAAVRGAGEDAVAAGILAEIQSSPTLLAQVCATNFLRSRGRTPDLDAEVVRFVDAAWRRLLDGPSAGAEPQGGGT